MVENTEVKIEEKIYQIDWWGPFTLEKLKEEDAEYLNSISLYAKYQDHRLYGREVISYIGKVNSPNRTVVDRLSDKDHSVQTELIYTGTIYKFESWPKADEVSYERDQYIRFGENDAEIISHIEELLIYALWPAGNKRNKNTAKNSWPYRVFNTSFVGSLPQEVSGHYALYNTPKPDEGD